ncbi:hypothetical protein GCM10009664_65130 [Kitasatospora gansuensis]
MLRSCCMAWPSTVEGLVHIRIGTRMPGTSVYDMVNDLQGSAGSKLSEGAARSFRRGSGKTRALSERYRGNTVA